MIVDWDKISKIPDRLKADAIREGVDVEMAQSLIINSLREKRDNETFLAQYYNEKKGQKKGTRKRGQIYLYAKP